MAEEGLIRLRFGKEVCVSREKSSENDETDETNYFGLLEANMLELITIKRR